MRSVTFGAGSETPSPRSRDRTTARALGILAAFWLVLFSPQLFSHQAFLAGDATLFRRFSEFSSERWRVSHVRTFWNPYVFMGVPATASLADMRPQYMPDALIDAWETVHGVPGLPPLAAPLAAHLIGMLAIALLARELWRSSATGMVWAGIAWAMAPGLIVPFTFGHDAQFVAASLLPVLLLCAHHVFAADDEIRAAWAALALGVALGVQCLAGHPQIVVAGAILLVSFMLERAIRFARPRRIAFACAALMLGTAIGAAVWWPALLYARGSVRGGAGGASAIEVASFSHAWRDLVTLFWPRALGTGGATYWGGLRKTDFPQAAGTLVCALALFARPRAGRAERNTVALLWGAIFCALLLSLGIHLGVFDRALRAGVPLFSSFRVSVTWLVISQPAFALLSALGLERVIARASDATRASRSDVLCVVVAALFVAFGVALVASPLGGHIASLARTLRSSLGPDAGQRAIAGAGVDLIWRALLPVVIAVLWWTNGGVPFRRVAAPLSLALLTLDLGAVDFSFLHSNSGPASRLAAAPPPPLARAAAAEPLARAMPFDVSLINTNDWIAWRSRTVTGVHGAIDRDWSTIVGAGLATHYEVMCALAIGYVVLPGDAARQAGLWTRVADDGAGRSVVRLARVLPRAYCVPGVSAPGTRADVLETLMSDSFRAHDVAVADDREVAGAYPGSKTCTLAWIEDSPDHLCIATQAREASFLVVADPLLPGWSARVDGRSWPLHRVNYMLRGVQVPAGRHVVEMTYLPPGWRVAMPVTRGAVAAVGLLALALGLARLTLRPRRARPGPPEHERCAA